MSRRVKAPRPPCSKGLRAICAWGLGGVILGVSLACAVPKPKAELVVTSRVGGPCFSYRTVQPVSRPYLVRGLRVFRSEVGGRILWALKQGRLTGEVQWPGHVEQCWEYGQTIPGMSVVKAPEALEPGLVYVAEMEVFARRGDSMHEDVLTAAFRVEREPGGVWKVGPLQP